jgi:hypothetical protein
MNPKPENHKSDTRPVFKFLAGFLGVLFLLTGLFTISFALQTADSGALFWRWIVVSALFVCFGAAFMRAAFTGRWPFRK